MKRSTRYAISAILLIVGLSQSTPSANAAWLQYQTSPIDSYNRPDLTAAYDINNISFGVHDTKPNEYWFFLNFTGIVTSSTFADGLDSWAAVYLDLDLDGRVDYSLETSDDLYKGNYIHSGRFVDRRGSGNQVSNLCKVNTWTNLDTKATWIGFSIPKTCLPIGATLGIQGYSDHISNDGKNFDYAPGEYWNVNVKGGAVTSPGSSSSDTPQNQLPSFNLNTGKPLLTNPSNQPNDLVALAASTTKSVVTVFCGDGLGSGWSINASLSAANISNGYKSYIITNHHVIASCTTKRNIFIALPNQVKVPAYVYAWDEANDVAGILTSTQIEPLDWFGSIPQQGWWVGVIGSPLGFPGILTTGIISSINTSTFLGTTNAAINSGNSGGPIFDRNGRVIGLATAKYIDSEGFGIFHGTPLLCGKVIKCESTSQIWNSATTLSEAAADAKAADAKAAVAVAAANKIIADAAAAADKIIADAKAAVATAAADKIITDAKAAVAAAAANKIIADAAAEADKIIADAKAAVAKAAVDKAAADKIIADATAAADKIIADAKAAVDKAAVDKAATDKIIADATAAADKIIADAKAAVDKAAVDKAAVDKVASDKIIADAKAVAVAKAKAAAKKLITITCIKGKLVKKVTAVKPKCPSGYKVKS